MAGETYGSALNAINPDLSAFRDRGGKLIMYHGFSDGFITPYNSIRYYNDVVATMGEQTQQFARLFMVPGMGHCAGGPGATTFDPLSALERWVEQGIAPERIIGSHVNADMTVAFTRPFCPYPQEARYSGSGSIDDAANFVCGQVAVTPLPLVDSFGGDAIDSGLWSVAATQGTATEGGGTLTLAPSPLSGDSRISVTSNALYDLTGSAASVQVNEVVHPGEVNTIFSLQVDWDNALEWWFENGFLYGINYVGGARSVVATLNYLAHP